MRWGSYKYLKWTSYDTVTLQVVMKGGKEVRPEVLGMGHRSGLIGKLFMSELI